MTNTSGNGGIVIGENHDEMTCIHIEIKHGAGPKPSSSMPNNAMSIDPLVLPSIGIHHAWVALPQHFPGKHQRGSSWRKETVGADGTAELKQIFDSGKPIASGIPFDKSSIQIRSAWSCLTLILAIQARIAN